MQEPPATLANRFGPHLRDSAHTIAPTALLTPTEPAHIMHMSAQISAATHLQRRDSSYSSLWVAIIMVWRICAHAACTPVRKDGASIVLFEVQAPYRQPAASS